MPIPALRAKQSTTTTGTGTLTLQAAGANARSFQAAFGAVSTVVRYVISGGSFYEIGIGTFNGGSPGTLTRTTVLASSNAGSLVSLPAGTADVFTYFDPLDRTVILTSATSLTLAVADLGAFVNWGGGSALTLNLPAAAGVPIGAGYEVRNGGAANITVDPNGAETINGAATITLTTGQSAIIRCIGADWAAIVT